MPTISLADTGSKAAHRNLSPIPGSPLADYNCPEAVTGRSDGSAAMQEGTPLPRLPAQTLLPGAKTALLPAVCLHTSITSLEERLPEAHTTDDSLRR